MDNKIFFMVFLEGSRTPVVKYDDFEVATKEAARLSLTHGKTAFVLESVVEVSIRKYHDQLPF